MSTPTCSFWDKLRGSIQRRGFSATLSAGLFYLWPQLQRFSPAYRRFHRQDPEFDRQFGTDTAGKIELNRFTIQSENVGYGYRYQSTLPAWFREVMAALPIRCEDFTFLDLGSGKGRVLLLASDYPFQKIIGVEFAEELHQIALNNFRVYQNPRQKCQDLASVLADVTAYPIPSGPVVVYLNNPFQEKVLRSCLDNLGRSWERDPRDIFILYRNPTAAHVIEQYKFLRQFMSIGKYLVYRSVPRG